MPRKIRSNYMEKFKFVYNGRIFDSKHKCCEFYGICYRSVMSYQNRHKCTTEESITHFIELKKRKEIIFRNRKWNSIKTCCEFYDLNEASVKTDMWNRKCTPQEAIERAIEWKKTHEITYHGVKYPSLPQCCENLALILYQYVYIWTIMGFLPHVRLRITLNPKRDGLLHFGEKNIKTLRNVVLHMD